MAATPKRSEAPPANEIAAALLARLSTEAARVVRNATELAQTLEVDLYLVGGTVRDLILGVEPRDLDLLVNEKGEELATLLARNLDGRLETHPEFLTADVRRESGLPVDVAAMRAEEYPRPGALPVVRRGTLSQDLGRRDFTVNALALQLFPLDAVRLVDQFDGRNDLEGRCLRVLHDGSFRDDPTRAIRGVRLAAELGFEFTAETRDLAIRAAEAGAFDTLSGERLWRELSFAWKRLDTAAESVRRLDDLRILSTFLPRHPAAAGIERALVELLSQAERGSRLGAVIERAGTPWVVLELLMADLASHERGEVAGRLGFSGHQKEKLAAGGQAVQIAADLLASGSAPPHEVCEFLNRVEDAGLALLWLSCGGRGRERLEWYLSSGRDLQLGIGGADLLAHGVESGPIVGEALSATRRARLDGQLEAARELEFALEFARRRSREAGGRRSGP